MAYLSQRLVINERVRIPLSPLNEETAWLTEKVEILVNGAVFLLFLFSLLFAVSDAYLPLQVTISD